MKYAKVSIPEILDQIRFPSTWKTDETLESAFLQARAFSPTQRLFLANAYSHGESMVDFQDTVARAQRSPG